MHKHQIAIWSYGQLFGETLNDVTITSSHIRFLWNLNTNWPRVYLSDIQNFILIKHKRAEIQGREVNRELRRKYKGGKEKKIGDPYTQGPWITPPQNRGGVIFSLQCVCECVRLCLWTKFQPNGWTALAFWLCRVPDKLDLRKIM